MLTGGNKYQKIQRKKPKRLEYESLNDSQSKKDKTKHHDRSYYRLLKQEKDYGIL